MQWCIQCTELPDTHTLKLLEAAKARNLPTFGIGIIPFSHELTGLEEIDASKPCMFYGSIQLLQKIQKDYPQYYPAMYFQEELYDPLQLRLWQYSNKMLNRFIDILLVSDLRKNWIKQPMFVKSRKPKLVTGMVLEPEKDDWDTWVIEHAHLDGDAVLAVSPIQKIDKEWRFFVIDGEVVTGSLYRRDGYRCIYEPISQEVWDEAIVLAKELPSKNIVMDVARTCEGEYKIIEFNSINSSGFYNCDIGKIVDKIEKMHA